MTAFTVAWATTIVNQVEARRLRETSVNLNYFNRLCLRVGFLLGNEERADSADH